MAVKKKAPRRRQKRVFPVNAIQLGAALSLINSTDAAGAAQQMLSGNLKGGLKTLTSNVQSNRTKILQTIGATAAAKVLAKGFRLGRIAKLGPLAVRV